MASELKLRVMWKLQHLLELATNFLRNSQKQYKKDFDNPLKYVKNFEKGDSVYVHRCPTWTLTATDSSALEVNYKRLPMNTCPFQIIRATMHNVTIDEDRIENTVSIDHVTLAPKRTTDEVAQEKGEEGNPQIYQTNPLKTMSTSDLPTRKTQTIYLIRVNKTYLKSSTA